MDVLVVRHAIALDKHALDKDEANELGVPDAERPLTKGGRRRMKGVARGLARSVPNLSVLFSSPWRRAVETADLLRARCKGLGLEVQGNVESDALLPDAEPEALAECLAGIPVNASVAVVGHEPHLSSWVSWCLTGGRSPSIEPRPILQLRKAGACLLRFEDAVGPSRGKLLWLMPPAVLRQL
ncbi:MAG: histidine phosphatase family protein [Deltaproteobacteria bacterium]